MFFLKLSKRIKNIKYDLYQNLCLFFPKYFKSKYFKRIKSNINTIDNLSEKEIFILQFILDEKSIVIDVGANNGIYCYLFKEILKCEEVFAFEPLPLLYKKLTKWFKDINFYPYALSNSKSIYKLRIPYINSLKYETRAKLDPIIEKDETSYTEIIVETRTLDSILLDTNKKIDFIKIDVEGHEWNVILGALGLIKKYKPIMMVEIEKRHHEEQFMSKIENIIKLGYICCYFNYEKLLIESIDCFIPELYQNINNMNNSYINNFLFFPINSISINHLNEKIKIHFEKFNNKN